MSKQLANNQFFASEKQCRPDDIPLVHVVINRKWCGSGWMDRNISDPGCITRSWDDLAWRFLHCQLWLIEKRLKM
jgi:hypothetical protein